MPNPKGINGKRRRSADEIESERSAKARRRWDRAELAGMINAADALCDWIMATEPPSIHVLDSRLHTDGTIALWRGWYRLEFDKLSCNPYPWWSSDGAVEIHRYYSRWTVIVDFSPICYCGICQRSIELTDLTWFSQPDLCNRDECLAQEDDYRERKWREEEEAEEQRQREADARHRVEMREIWKRDRIRWHNKRVMRIAAENRKLIDQLKQEIKNVRSSSN